MFGVAGPGSESCREATTERQRRRGVADVGYEALQVIEWWNLELRSIREGRKESSGANTQENMGGRGRNWPSVHILTNLAGEHCLTVQRNGQNDWFPVAAGALALVSTPFTWSWIDVLLSALMTYYFIPSPSQLPTQTPPCLTTNRWLCLLWKTKSKVLVLNAIEIFLTLSCL